MELTSRDEYVYELNNMVLTLSAAVGVLEALRGKEPVSYPSKRQMKALVPLVGRVGAAVDRLAKRVNSLRLSAPKMTPEIRRARRIARAEAILREEGYAVHRADG